MENPAKKSPILPWYTKVMSGTGSLGYGMVQQAMTGLLIFFGVAAHGVPGGLMGLAASVAVVWDCLLEPLVGQLSDRVESRFFGKRYLFLLLGTVLVAIFNIMLWSVPESGTAGKFFWFFFMILFLESSNTILQTPYQALCSELSGNSGERRLILVLRNALFIAGLALPAFLGGAIVPDRTLADGYQNMAYLSSTLVILCGLATFFGTYTHLPRLLRRYARMEKPPRQSIKEIFKGFYGRLLKKNYRQLFIGYTLALFVGMIMSSLGMMVMYYAMHMEFWQICLILGPLFLTNLASQPLWMRLLARREKKDALLLGLIIAGAGIIWFIAVFIVSMTTGGSGVFFALLPSALLTGLGAGAFFTIPSLMMDDLSTLEQSRTNRLSTGMANGVLLLAHKLAQSAALLLTGITVSAALLKPAAAEQSLYTGLFMGITLCVFCAAAVVAAALFFSKYSLKSSEVPETTEPEAGEGEREGEQIEEQPQIKNEE